MNPLCGQWVGPDEYASEVEYAIFEATGGLSVRAVDQGDGEIAFVSDVTMADGVLSFKTAWTSGRICGCQIRLCNQDEAEIVFSFTDRARLIRKSDGVESAVALQGDKDKGVATVLPSSDCARVVRDGGIDAVAALNEALKEALVGLSSESQGELRRAFGRAVAAILDETVNPAVSAFPELEPDDVTWVAVAKSRALARSND